MIVINVRKNTSDGTSKPYLYLTTGGVFYDNVLSLERFTDILECSERKLKNYINKHNGEIIKRFEEPVIAFHKNKYCKRFVEGFYDEFEKELVLKKISDNEEVCLIFRKSNKLSLNDVPLQKTLAIAVSFSIFIVSIALTIVFIAGRGLENGSNFWKKFRRCFHF